jgi:hypothetical protein
MNQVLFAVLVLSLAFSQTAGLHYHAHHDEGGTSPAHADHHVPHHAATLHTDEPAHAMTAEVETFGPLSFTAGSALDMPYLFAAILLLAWLVLGGTRPWQPAPPWKPKPAHRRLRPPLRAPPH